MSELKTLHIKAQRSSKQDKLRSKVNQTSRNVALNKIQLTQRLSSAEGSSCDLSENSFTLETLNTPRLPPNFNVNYLNTLPAYQDYNFNSTLTMLPNALSPRNSMRDVFDSNRGQNLIKISPRPQKHLSSKKVQNQTYKPAQNLTFNVKFPTG